MAGSGAPTAITDRDLAAAALKGDRQAFGDLVCRYRDGVVNVVYRMCGDEGLAEEAAQEAFLRAWQRLDSYKPEHPFRNWIFTIATRIALDKLRREPQTVDVEAVQVQAPSGSPEAEVERRERARKVQQAVLALPAAGRAVLVLREYEGLSYQEIAEVLGIPVGTVMSRLNYARSILRKSLADELEAG